MNRQPTRTASFIDDPVALDVLWNGLISVVSEVSTTLIQIAFSTLVREVHDYTVVIMDKKGRLAFQDDTAPSFLYTLPITTQHALRKWPLRDWKPGDVILTNDPWLATGHLNDITVITPVFRANEVVGFVGSIAHTADIGGVMWSTAGRDVFEEGLFLPLTKIRDGGENVTPLWEIIEANVRVPKLVVGDLRGQVLANDQGARRIVEFLDENGVDDFEVLTEAVQARAEQALRRRIDELPDGEHRFVFELDGRDQPIQIDTTIRINGSDIVVDFSGTSPQVEYGVNSVYNYTAAYTLFTLQCVLFDDVPCNDGCFRPFRIIAPRGSVLNPRRPAAVAGRHSIGHHTHVGVFGALAEVLPDRVMAPSSTPYALVMNGPHPRTGSFSTIIFIAGAWGARFDRDGHSALSWPPPVANTPLEMLEQEAPIAFVGKRIRQGSGGSGRYKGGNGLDLSFKVLGNDPISLAAITNRTSKPTPGLQQGGPGAVGSVTVNGNALTLEGIVTLRPGDLVRIETPGAGGFGRADSERIEQGRRSE